MRGALHGVTLLELLLVVSIIGILATLAYPGYRDHVARAKRTEARTLLLEIAVNQERFYLTAHRFGTLEELGYATPLYSTSRDYQFDVALHDAGNFAATATYRFGGREAALCSQFAIDAFGNKSSSGSMSDCWTNQH